MKETVRLSLYIPEPKFRPGDQPDFSHIKVGAAGSVRRPELTVPARETTDLAYALIRVLDETGHAIGPWDPQLAPDLLRRGLRVMLLTRAYDDRMYPAQRTGKTSFYMKNKGFGNCTFMDRIRLRSPGMYMPKTRETKPTKRAP